MNISLSHKARILLAVNIAHYRLQRGWSQEIFADKLGTSPTVVSLLENAKRNTRIDYIEHISNTLNVPIYRLFEYRDPNFKRRISEQPKNK